MSREAAGDVPLGAAATAGNNFVSEPAFELLFSEIIAYTGAYVSHSAASHATDMFRAAEAGVEEEEGGDKDSEGEGGDNDANGALVGRSPASVGAGNQLLPVRFTYSPRSLAAKNTRTRRWQRWCATPPALPVCLQPTLFFLGVVNNVHTLEKTKCTVRHVCKHTHTHTPDNC